MKNVLVCVFDRKAQCCAAPVLFRNTDEAKRAFSMAISKDPMLSQFPDDYDIVKVADIDIETADVVASKSTLCCVRDLIVAPRAQEVSGSTPGTFPVQEVAPQVDQAPSEKVVEEGQKRHITFGGYQK